MKHLLKMSDLTPGEVAHILARHDCRQRGMRS